MLVTVTLNMVYVLTVAAKSLVEKRTRIHPSLGSGSCLESRHDRSRPRQVEGSKAL